MLERRTLKETGSTSTKGFEDNLESTNDDSNCWHEDNST